LELEIRKLALKEKILHTQVLGHDTEVLLIYPDLEESHPDYCVEATFSLNFKKTYRAVFCRKRNRERMDVPAEWDDNKLLFVTDLNDSTICKAIEHIIFTGETENAFEAIGENEKCGNYSGETAKPSSHRSHGTDFDRALFTNLRNVIQSLRYSQPDLSDERILQEIHDRSISIIDFLNSACGDDK